jgi:rhodanese-related sulfurtransferase
MAEKTFDDWLRALDFEYWSTGQHKIMPAEFFKRLRAGEGVILLDVRFDEELDYLALPFALQIPINQLPDRWREVPADRLVATFCSGGDRAVVAHAYLQNKGLRNVLIFKGGYAELMPELMPGKVRRLIDEAN